MNSEYICDHCSRSFTRKHNLQTHIENCHLNSTCYCDICEARFGSPAGLQLHLNRGHNRFGRPSPECDICGRIFTRKQNIVSHMTTVHIQSQRPRVRCNLCSKIFTSERNLKRHLYQLHNPNFTYLFCDECNKVFKGKQSLIAHIQTVHSAKRGVVKCNLCVKVYSNKRNLKRHMEINHRHHQHNREAFKCDSCIKVYTSNQSLKRHVRSTHKLDKMDYYTCKFCNKIIVGKKNYRTHTLLHHSEEKQSSYECLANFSKNDLKCDTCSIKYDRESALRQHIKLDHGFEEFYTYCKRSLLLKSLARHPDRYKSNSYYSCEFCSNTFNTVYDLKDHMENKHRISYALCSCYVCFEKFFSKETLEVHKNTCIPPSNVNQCNHCDKLFTDISSLKFHVRVFHPDALKMDSFEEFDEIENSDRDFSCTRCDRLYRNVKSLRHHMKLKHCDDIIKCESCGIICDSTFDLTSHMRLVHCKESSSKWPHHSQELKTKKDVEYQVSATLSGQQKYRCDECTSLFKERKSLRKHIRAKHPNSSYYPRCPVCEKQFESEKSCRIHQKLQHSIDVKKYSKSLGVNNDSHTHLYNNSKETYSPSLLPKDSNTNDAEVDNSTVKNKSPFCIICVKDFSSRKTLKRHIKKFHIEFDVNELANFGTERPNFHVDCVDCIKHFTDDYHFSIYLKSKHLARSVIFKCETCRSSYNTLEYSIQRYKNLDTSKNKLYLSELCTTEMSDVDTQIDFRANVETGGIFKRDLDLNSDKHVNSDKRLILVKSDLGCHAVIKLEPWDSMSDIDIKREPLTP